MQRREVMGLLAGALAISTAGCGGPFRKRYRFKLTVEVETPEGLKSGSSVIEVWAAFETPGSQRRMWRVRGEAVAVDLPGGQTLFALLKTNAHYEDMAGLSMMTLDPRFQYDVVESAERIARRDGIRSPAEVAPKDYPLLVRFRGVVDPASVRQVDPADLVTSFGPGMRLKRITVEVTDDAVTTGIEKRLVWLPRVYKILQGTAFHPEGIPVGDFRGLFTTEKFQ